jgi:hypothetical protein
VHLQASEYKYVAFPAFRSPACSYVVQAFPFLLFIFQLR